MNNYILTDLIRVISVIKNNNVKNYKFCTLRNTFSLTVEKLSATFLIKSKTKIMNLYNKILNLEYIYFCILNVSINH